MGERSGSCGGWNGVINGAAADFGVSEGRDGGLEKNLEAGGSTSSRESIKESRVGSIARLVAREEEAMIVAREAGVVIMEPEEGVERAFRASG